ncbi:cation-translocating P-type ATPase [Ideonella aquatica]|uniref:cation-translocating P-type ATPase n=1 Tax=Ideonella aquatica TaxID=2824119 RepID=UPI0028739AB0|nr:HAD-IC family P-type ATPase [Ideonella aquatica]
MSTQPATAIDWHALPPGEALRRLNTDALCGLPAGEAARRLAQHGPNALPEPPSRPLWSIFLHQLRSPLIAILGVAAGLALAMGHLGDAAVIVVVVLVNGVLGSLQEGRAERSMAALRQLSAVQVRVWRDGAEQRVSAHTLVPGDLLLLAAGDAVVADARLLEAVRLQVAEAALTGESVPVTKTVAAVPEASALADRHCLLHAGTLVTAGRARAVVVATGRHTEIGRIAGLTERAQEPPTPLEQRLERFGRTLTLAALGLFALVMALGLWRGMPLAEVLMVAISQMVSMVPEGLPVAMTIALAVGMQRMAARGAIICRLAAVETLGSTTVICSDKTGTLTRNEMTVVALWLPGDGGGHRLDVQGSGYAPLGALQHADGRAAAPDLAGLQALARAAVLCNDAQLLPPADGGAWQMVGDPTEGALLTLAAKLGLDLDATRAAAPRLAEQPFDADTQRMATLHRCAHSRAQWLVKGSPEAVLRLCGAEQPDTLQAARSQAEALAAQALRVLALAVVDGVDPASAPAPDDPTLAARGRLLGLVGQIDPPREAAAAAVAACQAAGIRPVMVTGDHKLTGLAIARQLGIAGADDRAVDGPELERMGEAELLDALPGIAVFARVQPAQKLRIVEALQSRGEVVAMTGDGVNDAPALARADVGVAMGRSGTEVAKSAARIVITDDDFATLVHAVEQGRVVYANLKKVILYLFATSVDEVILLLLCLLAGLPLPLLAVQILWINIVTEGTLTVNLVMDPADGDEMRRQPTARNEALFDRTMLLRAALMALSAAAVAFVWFQWRLQSGVALDQARTEVFTLVALTQWFNMLNCRSATTSVFQRRSLRNRWLVGGLVVSVLLQAAVLYWPAMNALFHTVPLDGRTLLVLMALAAVVLAVEELRKHGMRA